MKFLSAMLIVACCAAPGIALARGGGVGGGAMGHHSAFHGSGGVHGNNHVHVVVHRSNRGFPFAVARRGHNGRNGAAAFPFGGFPFGVPVSGSGSYSSYPQEAGAISGPAGYPLAAPSLAAAMPPCRETIVDVTIVRGKSCRS